MLSVKYLALAPLFAASGALAAEMAMPMTMGSIKVISPAAGATITTTDIPVKVKVSNFKISALHAGFPDRKDEGHIHVMLDGMTMGVLYNFYTAEEFTLPGRAMTPGPHTLVFDLASNTHEDIASTVQEVKINYQPTEAALAPQAAANAGAPVVTLISPANGAKVGPKFTIRVKSTNFVPSLDLEGKPNIQGYGHYHVFVDEEMSMGMSEGMAMGKSGEKAMGKAGEMAMAKSGEKAMGKSADMSKEMSGGMMSMAGMISMPGSDTIDVDLTAWKKGKHTITIQPVQNDHTPIEGAKSAMFVIHL